MPSAPRDHGEAHVQTSVVLNEWTEFLGFVCFMYSSLRQTWDKNYLSKGQFSLCVYGLLNVLIAEGKYCTSVTAVSVR